MKELFYASTIVSAFILGVVANHIGRDNNLACAQAVLHNDVAKCSVYIVKDVMR